MSTHDIKTFHPLDMSTHDIKTFHPLDMSTLKIKTFHPLDMSTHDIKTFHPLDMSTHDIKTFHPLDISPPRHFTQYVEHFQHVLLRLVTHVSKMFHCFNSGTYVFHLRFPSNRFTNNQLLKGIVTGRHHLCHTVRHGLNMLIKAAKRGTQANTEICLPSNRRFIDDITVTTETNIQVRWIIMASNKYVS